ncbi:hypothetical protein EGW08_010873, partial [Elysia chlorotica]
MPDRRTSSERLSGLDLSKMLMLVLLAVMACGIPRSEAQTDTDFSDSADSMHIDLLNVIELPKEPGVDFTTGPDGYPVYELTREASLQEPAQFFFREPLTEEFSIVALINGYRQDAGYLFAVVNPYQTVIQFGVQLTAGDRGRGEQKLIVYYTPTSNLNTESQKLAVFTIPSTANRWTKLGIKVESDQVSLYLNCQLHERIAKTRQVKSLEIESGSHLYVGSAGSSFTDTPNFEGALVSLKIYGDPSEAEYHDDCDFDYSGSGDGSSIVIEPPITHTSSGVKGDSGDGVSVSTKSSSLQKGEKGDRGEKGDIGAPGPPGIDRPPMITPPPPSLEGLTKGLKGDRGMPGQT